MEDKQLSAGNGLGTLTHRVVSMGLAFDKIPLNGSVTSQIRKRPMTFHGSCGVAGGVGGFAHRREFPASIPPLAFRTGTDRPRPEPVRVPAYITYKLGTLTTPRISL